MFETKFQLFKFIIGATIVMAIANYNYFNAKYNKELFGFSDVKAKYFYTKYINLFTLIFIAIELNNFNGIYSYISFILTYIICAKIDKLYRDKFEKVLKNGDKEIKKYLKTNNTLTLKTWFDIRIKCLKNGYKDSFELFKYKFLSGTIILILYILLILIIRRIVK